MITQPQELYTRIAKKHGVSEELVREIMVYFWRYGVKRSMENMENHEIFINKLGSFKIKDYKLKYAIPEALKRAELSKYEIIKSYYYELYEKLQNIEKRIYNLKQEKQKFNEFNKQNPRNISQSQTDLGGTEE